MYAVFETGGKQYRVSPGDIIRVEKIEVETGSSVEFSRVLMVTSDSSVNVGKPVIDGASVIGTVVEQGRGKKIIVFKYKNKSKQSRRTQGHRQSFTSVRIETINI